MVGMGENSRFWLLAFGRAEKLEDVCVAFSWQGRKTSVGNALLDDGATVAMV